MHDALMHNFLGGLPDEESALPFGTTAYSKVNRSSRHLSRDFFLWPWILAYSTDSSAGTCVATLNTARSARLCSELGLLTL